MGSKAFHYNEITILKVIATFLITWFHFKWSVPEQYAIFFIGGAIGNSLFFYSSGYLLKFKDEKYKGEWLVKKYFRIMLPVYCFYVILLLYNLLSNTESNLSWYNFFYPTTYWFINAILCFFLVVYSIRIVNNNLRMEGKIYKMILFSIFILYILNYIFFVENHCAIIMDGGGVEVWFYFFLFFLWGLYDKQHSVKTNGNITSLLKVLFTIGLFYLYKKIAVYNDWLTELQVVLIPLLLALILQSFKELASFFYRYKLSVPKQRILNFLSNLTLDIYIVQMFLINLLMPQIIFPYNVLIIMVIIVFAAYINNKITSLISFYFNKAI